MALTPPVLLRTAFFLWVIRSPRFCNAPDDGIADIVTITLRDS